MRRLPLTVQTLYADLSQKVLGAPDIAASISRKMIGGQPYLYAVEMRGGRRVQLYLGPESDPDAVAAAETARRAAHLAKERRQTIAMLKRAGLTSPSREVGRVLDVMAKARLFDSGLVLVGTVAYQIYPALLGHGLEATAMITQDADFVAATVDVARGAGLSEPSRPDDAHAVTHRDLLAVLRDADESFRGTPSLDRKAWPCRFTAKSGLDVELLTPVRSRADTQAIPLPALGASAVPLPYLDYLVHEAVPAVVLHGSGVKVRVPQPARYAVHKLIVAQLRQHDGIKRDKDLAQAKALIDALDAGDPDTLDDAIEDALARGPKWRLHVAAGLRQIRRDRRA